MVMQEKYLNEIQGWDNDLHAIEQLPNPIVVRYRRDKKRCFQVKVRTEKGQHQLKRSWVSSMHFYCLKYTVILKIKEHFTILQICCDTVFMYVGGGGLMYILLV